MGFLGRLFGMYTPEERVARARAFLEKGEPNEARIELEGLDQPDAVAVHGQACEALVQLNLDEAIARFTAQDEDGAREHLEMAQAFGATRDQLREVRRQAREIRDEERRRIEAEQPAEVVEQEGDDPLWSLPPGDPRVRFAMLVESYPPALRERLAALGKDFAAAVLLKEDGQAAQAWDALSVWVEQEPAARLERAKAALAANQWAKAASDLATFGDALGHQRVGGLHTSVTLAQLWTRMGRVEDALELVTTELARDPQDLALRGTHAQLLEVAGRLEEAERVTQQTLEQAPRDMGLYRLLGRIRLRRDDRMGAMQALEGSLRVGKCETPGKCGYQPPDPDALRMLARLYLEDRIDPKRARQLLELLGAVAQQPTWDDAYLAALQARNDGQDTTQLVTELRAQVGPGDPRRALVDQAFAAQLTG
ncbi:MAG: tetratricopeptide repeat protein [Alphaproteobacteria bacterium]|nr:tetratricopeptide repeat protein [Alphaproteobacteria bacterium]